MKHSIVLLYLNFSFMYLHYFDQNRYFGLNLGWYSHFDALFELGQWSLQCVFRSFLYTSILLLWKLNLLFNFNFNYHFWKQSNYKSLLHALCNRLLYEIDFKKRDKFGYLLFNTSHEHYYNVYINNASAMQIIVS